MISVLPTVVCLTLLAFTQSWTIHPSGSVSVSGSVSGSGSGSGSGSVSALPPVHFQHNHQHIKRTSFHATGASALASGSALRAIPRGEVTPEPKYTPDEEKAILDEMEEVDLDELYPKVDTSQYMLGDLDGLDDPVDAPWRGM